MSMTWPRFKRTNPVQSLVADEGAFRSLNDQKTVVPWATTLEFGSISAASDRRLGFYYESAAGTETFVLGVGLEYVGDNGAFGLVGDEYGSYTAAMPLSSGNLLFWPITPDAYSETVDLIFRALAADAGVAKSGVLNIYDRFDFTTEGEATPTRLLLSVPMSKTYNP